MKQDDIFQAVGELDSEFLEQCEVPQGKGRKLWLILPIAALIAALGITAGADGFGRIPQGEATEVTVTNRVDYAFHEIEYETDELEVFVDLKLENNAPSSLQTIYLPKICEGLTVTGLAQGKSTLGDITSLTDLEIRWDHPDWQFLNNITFAQRTARWWKETGKTDTPVDYLSGTPVETKMLRWNDREAFMVTVGPSKDDLSQFHRLYWTDGDYVFILRCPYGIGEDWMKAAIESLAPTDNLAQIQEELSRRGEESQQDIWEDLMHVANSSPETFTKQFRPASGYLEILESGRPKLRLDEVAAPDAPEKVEMIIFPSVALTKDYFYHTNCIPTFVDAPDGVQKGIADYFAVGWHCEQGGHVEYWQIPHNSTFADRTITVGGSLEDIQLAQVQIGSYTLLQVTGLENQVEHGSGNGIPADELMGKTLYWMDDDYRYRLNCPLAMTDAEILEFLDSLDRLQ